MAALPIATMKAPRSIWMITNGWCVISATKQKMGILKNHGLLHGRAMIEYAFAEALVDARQGDTLSA